MYQQKFVKIPYEEIPGFQLVGGPEYTQSVYDSGIHIPVTLATWKNKTYLVGGNRRIASLIEARKRATEDGTLPDRPWLNELPAMIMVDMPLDAQTAWALAENEERSENLLGTYLMIKAALKAGYWDQVQALFKLNKGKEKLIMRFDNLLPELLEMALDGRMAKGVAVEAATLNEPRQRLLLQIFAAKKPDKKGEKKITAKDIKEARTAHATAQLQAAAINVVPQQAGSVLADQTDFLVLDLQTMDFLKDRLFTSYSTGLAFVATNGGKLYRLVQLA